MAVRRAVATAGSGIAATEGICDRVSNGIEASLAGTTERRRHHPQVVFHPINKLWRKYLYVRNYNYLRGID